MGGCWMSCLQATEIVDNLKLQFYVSELGSLGVNNYSSIYLQGKIDTL